MFRHMDYIYNVYLAKSFSKAAKKMFISQSSLSLTIKKAEQLIGTPVFDRRSNPLELTEFGKHYIEAVEIIKKLTVNLDNYIYDINNMKKGHITVGAGNFLATYLLPSIIVSYKEKYPNINVDLHEKRTTDLIKDLETGYIDLIMTGTELNESQFTRFQLCRENMILVVPEKIIPLAYKDYAIGFDAFFNARHSAKKVSLRDFALLPFVSLRSENPTRIRNDRLFNECGIQPNIVLELDQASTAYRVSCSGMGACIVSDLLVHSIGANADVCFFLLDSTSTQRNVSIYMKKNNMLIRALTEFIFIAQEKMQQ